MVRGSPARKWLPEPVAQQLVAYGIGHQLCHGTPNAFIAKLLSPALSGVLVGRLAGSQASTAEVERELMELWSAVEKDKEAARERALAARRAHLSRLRHQVLPRQQPF